MIGQVSFLAQLADHPLNPDVFRELGGMSESRSRFVRVMAFENHFGSGSVHFASH